MDTGDSGSLLSSRPASTASLTSLGATGERASISVVEDEVDEFLSKEDGRIARGKNEQM